MLTDHRTAPIEIVVIGASTGAVEALHVLLPLLATDLRIPIVVVVDWLVDPARHRLPLWVAAAWLAYPGAYLAYTLVRGAIVDWYPYPFVDVSELGYGGVALRCAGLLVGFVVASLAFVVIGNWRAGQATPAAAQTA